MSKMEECEIKGQKYRLMKLSPLEGGRVATLVGRNLAGALDEKAINQLLTVYTQHESSKDSAEQEPGSELASTFDSMMGKATLLTALSGGVAKIDADALYSCALVCIRGNLFADHKLHDDTAINMWFADRPQHLLPILAWALKVNCAGFFGLGEKA